MASQYENEDLLKIQTFYTEEIKNKPKKSKKPKKPKKYTKKRGNRLTKYKILSNILPLYEAPVISLWEHAFRNHIQTYEVEPVDSKTLADSLFLAKESIINLF